MPCKYYLSTSLVDKKLKYGAQNEAYILGKARKRPIINTLDTILKVYIEG